MKGIWDKWWSCCWMCISQDGIPPFTLPGNRNWFTREPVERWWIKQPEWDEPQAEEWISCSQTQPRCCYLVAPVSRRPPAFEFLLFILRVPSACCL